MFSRADFAEAQSIVYRHLAPTPQHRWPILSDALGVDVVVKHENHLMTGAFKVRGGLTYLDRMRHERPAVRGICGATRGNHGQSLAFAARAMGLPATIVVPHGNSTEKNAAMRALGAELVEYGRDFDEAKDYAIDHAARHGFEMVPSYHPDLVRGVGTYGVELFEAAPDLDAVYVPIGLGSGICGLIAAKAALGAKAEIVGVVAEGAPAYALSFEAGRVVPTNTASTFADGMAVRGPSAEAFEVIRTGASRIVKVSDGEIAEAMRLLYRASHNLAEGAGAAALAAVAVDRARLAGQSVGVILSGGNIDGDWYATVLNGGTPVPR